MDIGYKDILENLPGGVIVFSADDTFEILYANQKALNIFDTVSFDELRSLPNRYLVNHLKKVIKTQEKEEKEKEKLQTSSEVVKLQKDIVTHSSQKKTLKIMIRPSSLPESGRVYMTFISVLKDFKAENQFDPLTGLYTKDALIDIAEKRRLDGIKNNAKTPYTIIYFNLSRFKLFNATFGLNAGDEYLQKVGKVLKTVFKTNLISRFTADHFIVIYEKNDELEKINLAHNKVLQLHAQQKLWLEAGVYYGDRQLETGLATDLAKIACDEIKDNAVDYYMIYTSDLKEEITQRKYIIDHIDEAISHGYIKVVFQPVIRTLTGYLCGLEALARWDDPKHGLISPAVFIPVLEQTNLAYKVDRYVVDHVARTIRERLDRHVAIVPVSINISRSDFNVSNPFEFIEETVHKYSLLREYINIELTESAVIEDPDFIRNEINRFRAAGYEVWMDDYGSAYSSLNVLKDFEFDEIKIDMLFLKDLNERSKKIVTATVDMSKKLGIHTLAEGVETEEQLEFLKHIGCEKVQGYYYGKPMAIRELITHFRTHHIPFEDSMLREFYNKASRINVITDRPVGIFFDDGIRFKELYLNNSYKEVLKQAGLLGAHPVENIMRPESFLNKTFRRLADQSITDNRATTMDFVLNDRYFRFISENIARCSKGFLHVATVSDITYDGEKKVTSDLDTILRRVITIYGAVLLFDSNEQSFSILKINYGNDHAGNGDWKFYESSTTEKMAQYVYWKDRDHFICAFTHKNIVETLKRTTRGSFTDTFRIKNAMGNYIWTSFTLVVMENSDDNHRFMVCIKPSSIADKKDPDAFARTILEHNSPVGTYNEDNSSNNLYFTLWNALNDQTDLKLFWKDTNRRFLGATKAFLDYYNFGSIKDIIGKTDDELGWHPDNRPFRNHEEKVLKAGAVIKEAHGTNVIRGVIHNISATKFPIYKNGNIVGLMGYFVDLDEIYHSFKEFHSDLMIDKTTSLMNMRGFLSAITEYEDSNKLGEEKIALIVIDIPVYAHLFNNYGAECAEKLIALCATKVREHFVSNSSISRIQKSRFCILAKEYKNKNSLEEDVDNCIHAINSINEIDGRHVTVYTTTGIAFSYESDSFFQLMNIALSRMHGTNEKTRSLTPSELEVKIRSLSTLFDKVTVIDVPNRKTIEIEQFGMDVDVKKQGFCNSFWNRARRCPNCIAAKALKNKGYSSKFDKLEDDVYFVFAHYVNVLGDDYVIESMIKLDESPFTHNNTNITFANIVDKYNSEVYTDSLTKIRNRKYYNEQLLHSESDAVAFMDVDKFKSINDTLGHRAGDEVLINVARCIKHSIRNTDMVIRYAGDEFAVFFSRITRKMFEKILNKIRDNVAALFADPEKTINVSISIGGCYGYNKTDFMILKADNALYEAKKGAGIVIVETSSVD